jgi:glycyl-tRNA synthetase beta chain
VVVALADKLETLVGMFGIGNLPTGDKDPFALRRHAQGVIRMMIEKELALDLVGLIKTAFASLESALKFATWKIEQEKEMARRVAESKGAIVAFGASYDGGVSFPFDGEAVESNISRGLTAFVSDRLSSALREQGCSAQEVDSVLALRPKLLSDVPRRLQAVRAFAALPEAPALAAANKRIGNILKKSEGEGAAVNPALFVEPAEKDLYAAMQTTVPAANAKFDAGDYTASLQALAALRSPVDAFFDGVMVNAEDPALKANRLGLLKSLHEAMNRVADLSRLAA